MAHSRLISQFTPRSLALTAVRWYQRKVSPLFPARCKYYPTCSQYMVIAIERFGAVRGILLGTLRLLRCQPWVRGGIDDVPQRFSLFYRFSWSRAHEEPTTEPVLAQAAALKTASYPMKSTDIKHQELASL